MADSLFEKLARRTASQGKAGCLMENIPAPSSTPVTDRTPSRTQIYAQYAKRINAQRRAFQKGSRAREFRTPKEETE